MFLLSDVLTYLRRIIKSPSDAVISDNLLIDYLNRFWISDVDARMQLFDLKTKYQFQTSPGVDQYNMPLYSTQIEPGNQTIGFYPVYQGFMGPAKINGVSVPFFTQRQEFFGMWPNFVQPFQQVGLGDGVSTTFTLQVPFGNGPNTSPNFNSNWLLRGHVDMAGVIATGNNIDPPLGTVFNTTIPVTSVFPAVYFTATDATGANVIVADSGQFLSGNVNYGLLMTPGNAPFGNAALAGGYSTTSNTINYLTGQAIVTFPTVIPANNPISAQCYYISSGMPRSVLFYNNILTLRAPPNTQYLVELDAYLTPAAFLNTGAAIPFGYMAEYLARGAARKILADTGDVEQFQFYEPLFREQETLVWKRSQRQFTATRTQTIYSHGMGWGANGGNIYGNNQT